MTRDDLIKQLRHSARDAAAEGRTHWHDYMVDAADMLEGVETFTFRGAPVIQGEGEGPTLSEIFSSLGLEAPVGLDQKIKGYQVQSTRTLLKDVAKATRVYRFEPTDPELDLKVEFFDTYEEAKAFGETLKYFLIAHDPETGKWSIDELGAFYG